jgi:hypothetical protein
VKYLWVSLPKRSPSPNHRQHISLLPLLIVLDRKKKLCKNCPLPERITSLYHQM